MQRDWQDGLIKWTEANRNIYNTDIVVWYTVGLTHVNNKKNIYVYLQYIKVVRAEDWPVMPVEYCGFDIKPGFLFLKNIIYIYIINFR